MPSIRVTASGIAATAIPSFQLRHSLRAARIESATTVTALLSIIHCIMCCGRAGIAIVGRSKSETNAPANICAIETAIKTATVRRITFENFMAHLISSIFISSMPHRL
jgi:hypothetical protein